MSRRSMIHVPRGTLNRRRTTSRHPVTFDNADADVQDERSSRNALHTSLTGSTASRCIFFPLRLRAPLTFSARAYRARCVVWYAPVHFPVHACPVNAAQFNPTVDVYDDRAQHGILKQSSRAALQQ
ncbi:hypothetical protein HYPSUDRAFT_43566 [Hypholoma sublateritium FD-334 SS-4]|uniref:Uncharacterized protein n=1 Tax=Hypholoma sublateritium (strain FD-334 SS-4) TaxID=945553 RepID=A0A0D2KZT6_HYPSF|nr:hypothetical protein HYPSUDRAFT_43566 [Hypholoma sublateritium FD-334 SS-4]